MISFLNPHNATSLTGVVDITAHSLSLFQENEPPQDIKDTFIPKSDISVAELMMFRSMNRVIMLLLCISFWRY